MRLSPPYVRWMCCVLRMCGKCDSDKQITPYFVAEQKLHKIPLFFFLFKFMRAYDPLWRWMIRHSRWRWCVADHRRLATSLLQTVDGSFNRLTEQMCIVHVLRFSPLFHENGEWTLPMKLIKMFDILNRRDSLHPSHGQNPIVTEQQWISFYAKYWLFRRIVSAIVSNNLIWIIPLPLIAFRPFIARQHHFGISPTTDSHPHIWTILCWEVWTNHCVGADIVYRRILLMLHEYHLAS